jgi:hypothetical protein
MVTLPSALEDRASVAADAEASPPAWMLDLERAHDQLRHAALLLEDGALSGPIDLRPAAPVLERAYRGIFDAFEERAPRLEATRAALDALEEAVTLLSEASSAYVAVGFALDYLAEATSALLAAEQRLAPLVPRAPQPAPELRASADVPRLHALGRPSLAPQLRLPAPTPPLVEPTPQALEKPKSFEDLARAVEALRARSTAKRPLGSARAETEAKAAPDSPVGFAQDVGRALSEAHFVRDRARECFDEVVMIGLQRAPLLGEPWRNARILERRMLAAIDAIVAMGPAALGSLERLVLDAPLKDPPRLFAFAMVLGCVDGRDALAMAERVFLAFERSDPEHATHLAAALKLAPNPYVPLALRTLLGDGDPAHRALAVDVLAYRGLASEGELERAAFDELDVAAAALPWFAVSRSRRVREAIDRALESESVRARQAARLGLVLRASRRAGRKLGAALSSSDAEEANHAASLLAIVATREDAELLLERARATPSRPLVQALGWAGSPGAVPFLIELLERSEKVAPVAAEALDRITNAGLFDEVVVEAEEIEAPDVPEPDVGLGDERPPPLARLVSDPRDLPAEPATETLRRPTVDAERWKAYWAERGESYDKAARYRRGAPYTTLLSHRELDRWPCTPKERKLLHWELVARTRGDVRFDPLDFVSVQEAAVSAWEPIAQRASGEAGRWWSGAR